MTRADWIHWWGSRLIKFTYWLGVVLSRPSYMVMDWNDGIHRWMKRNHACCTLHGYKRDFDKRGL